MKFQHIKDVIQGPQERNLLVTEKRVRQKQEKQDTEENIVALNSGEIKYHKGKFFDGTCNKCGKYGHREYNCCGKKIKVNKNKNKVKTCFNGEYHNCGIKDHRAVFLSKSKDKEDDVDNLFWGATLCEELLESNKAEEFEEWLEDSDASLHIQYTKAHSTNI